MARRLLERHARSQHRRMITGKIIGFQKQKNPPAGLIADGLFLTGCRRPRQQQLGSPRSAGRGNRHPTLGRPLRGILDQVKAEAAGK